MREFTESQQWVLIYTAWRQQRHFERMTWASGWYVLFSMN